MRGAASLVATPLLLALLTSAAGPSALAAVAVSVQSDTWESAGTKRGVTLEFRDDLQLDAREVRASAELEYPVPLIMSVVCDFSAYGALVPGVTEATRLPPASDADAPSTDHFYLRYAPRFLIVAARDVVVGVRRQQGPDRTESCQWSEVEGRLPPRNGTVRIPLLRGAWSAAPLDASRAQVTYQFVVNPGGRLPGWLVRRGATGALIDVIDNLRALLRERSAGTARD